MKPFFDTGFNERKKTGPVINVSTNPNPIPETMAFIIKLSFVLF
ncbi:hypothetical protein ACQ86K_05585 [Mucilaginibacter sp. P19]